MIGTGGIEPPTSSVSRKRSPTELRAFSLLGQPVRVPKAQRGVNRRVTFVVSPRGFLPLRSMCLMPRGSHVEAEADDVAVCDDVVHSFQQQLAGLPAARLAARLHYVLAGH